MSLRRKKLWLRKSFLVLWGLAVGCFIAEIGLRLIGYSHPQFYTTDYDYGLALRPGIEGVHRKEGESYVRINSDGLRDREHSKIKPPNTVRIALLGDSFAEAMQVPMEQTFWSLLAQELRECHAFPGKDVEIINFGVSSYGTAQELITLRQKVWNYSPDIVLLALTTNNDIFDNSRLLSKRPGVPYFAYHDGVLKLDTSFRDSSSFRWQDSNLNKFGRWVKDHLRFVQLIHQSHSEIKTRLSLWRQQHQPPPVQVQQGSVRTEELGTDNMVYRVPQDETWKEAWKVTEGLIVQMRDEVRQRGAKFFVVTLSSPIQVSPNLAVRQDLMRRMGIDNLFYPNIRLKVLMEREQIEYLDLAQPFQTYADQNKVLLHGFGKDIGNGHWNADGHRLAAQLMAQKLCEGTSK